MTTQDTTDPIAELTASIRAELPDDVSIEEVTYEGPELVLYTDTPRKFADQDGLVRQLARTLKKRITVRPAAGTRTDPASAKQAILDRIDDDAGITDIEFHPTTGEVLVEAEKPGLVIGRRGRNIREITQEVGWTVEVLRTPPMKSSTVMNVRNFLKQEREERRAFLERAGDSIRKGFH